MTVRDRVMVWLWGRRERKWAAARIDAVARASGDAWLADAWMGLARQAAEGEQHARDRQQAIRRGASGGTIG